MLSRNATVFNFYVKNIHLHCTNTFISATMRLATLIACLNNALYYITIFPYYIPSAGRLVFAG